MLATVLQATRGHKQVAMTHRSSSGACFDVAIQILVTAQLGSLAELRCLSQSAVQTAGVENWTELAVPKRELSSPSSRVNRSAAHGKTGEY